VFVCTQGDVICETVQTADTFHYSADGAHLTLAGRTYAVSDIDSIVFTAPSHMKLRGGDVSLLAQYEDHGALYYDTDGNAIDDMLSYLKEQGWNALRLRLFVNPDNAPSDDKGEGVCQDLDYVCQLGARIKAKGFQLMLDFHYSDTWADPSQQAKPSAWSNASADALCDSLYAYTLASLNALVAAGATPDYIQTGNEISYGMLWDTGKVYTSSTSNWDVFTNMLASAAKACREAVPSAKIIVHTERVAQSDVLYQYYQNLKDYGVDYDVIGLSYYPYYHGNLATLHAVLNGLESRFADKKIMIVETGYYHDWQPSSVTYDQSSTYPITAAGQQAFAEALVEKLNAHAAVNGLFWWWPEANEYGLDWSTKRVTDAWYNAGLWDNQTGKAMPALQVLQNFK